MSPRLAVLLVLALVGAVLVAGCPDADDEGGGGGGYAELDDELATPGAARPPGPPSADRGPLSPR